MPRGSWPTFAGIHKNSSLNDKKSVFPLEVSPTINYGRMGEVVLTSLSNFDSGTGPTACIDFMLSGEILVHGNKTQVGQKGTITISTGEWGGWMSFWGNPARIMLAYNLIDSASINHEVDIPQSGHTKELIMELGLDDQGNRLAMKVETEKNLAFDVANVLLGGVYYVHKAAYGWAFGAVGGWPAAVGCVAGPEVKKLLFG
ncbi:hypothetical protein ST47_g744 [Ascochyta rabiei]|uniref:Uncharacterized protein n=1 Tax=Didymella rabiei TaxID=5454 RepID=A0A163LTX2_DIDRA|nr:hypothetical protein ST47_g744 [Ascochyta rabiei]